MTSNVISRTVFSWKLSPHRKGEVSCENTSDLKIERLNKQSSFSTDNQPNQTSEAVMRGGKRPGAGRKPGSVSATKARLQQTAIDVAAQVLSEVDAVAIWKKLILQQDKPQVVASVMEYLTDRVYGRPAQTVQGNPEQPIMIQ